MGDYVSVLNRVNRRRPSTDGAGVNAAYPIPEGGTPVPKVQRTGVGRTLPSGSCFGVQRMGSAPRGSFTHQGAPRQSGVGCYGSSWHIGYNFLVYLLIRIIFRYFQHENCGYIFALICSFLPIYIISILKQLMDSEL